MKKLFPSFPSLKVGFLFYGSLLMTLILACGGKEEKQVKAKKVKVIETNALSIIRKDDCLTCHSIEDKSAGPSYVMVAERYGTEASTVDRLADKIIAGGGGLWNGVMTKHAHLKKEDVAKVVRWVLSLDDSVLNPNPMVYIPGISLAEVFNQDANVNPENGLILNSYLLTSLGDYGAGFPMIGKEAKPAYSGIAKKIHLPTSESFKPLTEGFVLQASGFIHIAEKGKYFFKQVRSGKGRVFLNGEKKINESDWDRETHVDLTPGTYPITVEYLPGNGEKSLSLQWITPEREYYEVIPEEVFTYNR